MFFFFFSIDERYNIYNNIIVFRRISIVVIIMYIYGFQNFRLKCILIIINRNNANISLSERIKFFYYYWLYAIVDDKCLMIWLFLFPLKVKLYNNYLFRNIMVYILEYYIHIYLYIVGPVGGSSLSYMKYSIGLCDTSVYLVE